jgi:serine palmitoyltransferase
MSAPIAQQILTSLKILIKRDEFNEGAKRIEQLARNSIYFREKLIEMGFIVYGNRDSPVIPLML